MTDDPAPKDRTSEQLPPPSHPLAVARRLLPDWQTADGQLARLRWRGSWMRWTGTHWRELDEAQVRKAMYERLEHAVYLAPGKDGQPEERDWAPTKPKISNLLDALGSITLLSTEIDAPAWIDGEGETNGGPIVACENGLLRIRDRALLPHTPGLFNLVSVPFTYDPSATAPTWEHFLSQVWPDDPDAIAAVQEWFGYVLSGRTDQQKILLMVGPSRSGKGTIARVLKELVGKENLAGPTLAGLGTNFGLSTLIGKPLAVIADARLSGSDNNSQVVERLLTISGEDTIDIDRKYREVWTGKLPTRLVILSNELPHFGDSSGVIARRFVLLNMTVSWLGRKTPPSSTGSLPRCPASSTGHWKASPDSNAPDGSPNRHPAVTRSPPCRTPPRPPLRSSANAAPPDPRAPCPSTPCGRSGASGPRTTTSRPAPSRSSAATCSPSFHSSTGPALAPPRVSDWPPTTGSASAVESTIRRVAAHRDPPRLTCDFPRA